MRSHIFLCMLAHYVQRHMLEAWRPLPFSDEDHESKKHRHPVSPAQRSDAAMKKVCSRLLEDGTSVHNCRALLNSLSGIVRNTCQPKGGGESASFELTTTPNASQNRAFELLSTITL